MAAYPSIIKLDVGGTKYKTTLTTLCKYPDSMLGCMFDGNFVTTPNEDGEYFIDANGEMFKYILDFLRREKLMLPEDFKEFDLLLGEADFYQIQHLILEINELKDKRTPKETRTLLLVWVDYEEDEEWVEDPPILHAAYLKCSGVFKKISRDDPSCPTYEDFNEGMTSCYKRLLKSDRINYPRLLMCLYTEGVTQPPKEVDNEDTILFQNYYFEIWTIEL